MWGALIPLVGPYFRYAYTPDAAWSFTPGRIWLEIAPGVITLIGGCIVLVSSLRPVTMFGAWQAACGGAWFTGLGGLRRALPATSATLRLGRPVAGITLHGR